MVIFHVVQNAGLSDGAAWVRGYDARQAPLLAPPLVGEWWARCIHTKPARTREAVQTDATSARTSQGFVYRLNAEYDTAAQR